jgi:carboxyl-terminal processing protease
MENLARIATNAASEYRTVETEIPPRTFFCAIPDDAFMTLCDVLAERVRSENIPVGLAVESAVSSMVDLGLDPFTWYINPEQAKGFRLNGIVGGIGILLDATDAAGSKCTLITDACQLRIVFVLEDNPGFDAGLMPGDIITAVDGVSVDGKGFVDMASTISGDETGLVELSITRGGEAIDFAIERAELNFPNIEVDVPIDGVGYLRIPDFEFDIPRLVDDALDAILAAGPSTLVIDLRDNPGGRLDAVLLVASEFIASGVILSTEGPDQDFSYEALGGARATGQRLIVLVNEGTASAAEVLAGALQDQRNATVIGQPTFGKNAVQIPFELRNGGEFHVAIALWFTPDGRTVVDGGLVPDRIVDFPTQASIEDIVRFALENS